MRQTNIAMPEVMIKVFKTQWKRRTESPDTYGIGAHCAKQMKLYPVKYNSKSITVPYTGANTQLTQNLYTLLFAVAKATAQQSVISSSEESLITSKLSHWKKTGEFKRSSKAKKPKTIRSKRFGYTLTPQEQAKRGKLALVLKNHIESLVREYVRVAFKLFPDLPIELIGLTEIVFTAAPSVTRSSGGRKNGKPFMKFALSRIMLELNEQGKELIFHEYDAFAHDPEIGSVGGDIEVYLSALVAHELAHAIQFSVVFNNLCKSGDWNGLSEIDLWDGHGEGWRFIYRQLRQVTTNKLAQAKRSPKRPFHQHLTF